MRDSFVKALTELAENDRQVMLLTGDLGFGIFDDFSARFPKQFLNVGVAEQNMTGVATGLAMEGRTVFTYSIANFSTLRCLEQIRNDACYHEVNVNIVASGGGFTYGALGMSHHATEDLSILRALPGVTVVAPGDAWESAEATRALAANPGVGYLRIEKNIPINTYRQGEQFQLGTARRVREGEHLTFLCCGGILMEALRAADQLSKQGIEARVVSVHTLKPLDEEEIYSAARETGGIITVEENNILGGLGGAVAEICLEAGAVPKFFKRVGLPDTYSSIVGSQNYLRARYKIDSTAIIDTARHLLNR